MIGWRIDQCPLFYCQILSGQSSSVPRIGGFISVVPYDSRGLHLSGDSDDVSGIRTLGR